MKEIETVGDILDALPPLKEPSKEVAPLPAPREVVSAVTPMQMLQIAVEKGTDIVMLEKLMALHERWEATEARKAFVSALAAFKADPPTVIKNKHVGYESKRTNDKTDYDHATLDQVVSVIAPALSQHGLSHRWQTKQENGLIAVTCILTHERGHSEEVSLAAGADNSGSKNPIQAIGSTVTYLQRYTLLAITGLAAKDQDNDARTAATITPEQKAELIALLKETGADTRKFLDYIGITALDAMPASLFRDAKAALAKKKENAQ